MEARRFMILYQRERDRTLEREMVGTLDDTLRAAWQMLQEGTARVAAIVEPGNLEFHVWHNRIVRWGQEYGSREPRRPSRPLMQRSAA